MSNYGKWKNIYNKNHGRAIHKYFTRACAIVFTHPLADPKIRIEMPKYHDNT